MSEHTTDKLTEFPALDRRQRRVLGVLIEKGMTTPEYYPLTLKAVTTGCNQKSNRDPVTNLDEETVLETLEELRELGFTATVHTDGGRAERYRHYIRHRFDLTEPQIAVFAELLLRGRQQLGELRSRASRMTAIESLDVLRDALGGLMQMDAVRATGDLKRRGIEVDHGLYLDSEGESKFGANVSPPDVRPAASVNQPSSSPPSAAALPQSEAPEIRVDLSEIETTVSELEQSQQQLEADNRELTEHVNRLEELVRQLSDQLDDLKQQLGV
ncbi:MAG: DUF480 domain-containing protein [Planctomycetaceae bacterium]|jgi:uncharacterized protein|nr:DUF480 domain-containing protein [Planctomycetaceae bacterium]